MQQLEFHIRKFVNAICMTSMDYLYCMHPVVCHYMNIRYTAHWKETLITKYTWTLPHIQFEQTKTTNEWYLYTDIHNPVFDLPGPVFYETKRLLWRPHKQCPAFHLRCRIDKGLIKRGSTLDHWRSRCKGRIIMAHPWCIHSLIFDIVIKRTHHSNSQIKHPHPLPNKTTSPTWTLHDPSNIPTITLNVS
jgi:hypothetical protein